MSSGEHRGTEYIDPCLLPTDEEVAAFCRDGFYISRRAVLSNELIEQALFGVSRHYSGERDWDLPISGGYLDWQPEHGGCLRINDYLSLQNAQMREICTNPTLAAIAGRLMNTSEVRLFHDQLITKLPSSDLGTAVGWHVDRAYWRTCTSVKMLTAWIPLVEISEKMGGLAIIRGSHLHGTQSWMTTFNNQDLNSLEKKISEAGVPLNSVRPHVPLGHVSFHHCNTIHGSKPNCGDRPRIALTVHYQDKDNCYRSQTEEIAPALHINDLMCRKTPAGDPDYSDPEICPTLWRDERHHEPR